MLTVYSEGRSDREKTLLFYYIEVCHQKYIWNMSHTKMIKHLVIYRRWFINLLALFFFNNIMGKEKRISFLVIEWIVWLLRSRNVNLILSNINSNLVCTNTHGHKGVNLFFLKDGTWLGLKMYDCGAMITNLRLNKKPYIAIISFNKFILKKFFIMESNQTIFLCLYKNGSIWTFCSIKKCRVEFRVCWI